MDTARIESEEKPSRLRVPSVGVLIVLACFLLAGAVLLAWWTARSGIRQVEAIGGVVIVDGNLVSDFVTEYIEIDRKLLSTDHDVGHVALGGPHVDDEFASVLQRFPNIWGARLMETAITDRMLADLAEMTQITHLHLTDSPDVTDAGIAKLAWLPNLRYLYLENLPITGAGLSRLTHLGALQIVGCKTLKPTAIQELSRLPKLSSLAIRETRLTDESLQGFIGTSALKWLLLDANDITDASLSFIVEQFPDLIYLSLRELDGITDEGVMRLVALKRLQTLMILDSSISAETAKAIQKELPGCTVAHESTGW